MPEESLETKVAVLSNKVDNISDKINNLGWWGRWIGTTVGGYIVVKMLAVLQVLPDVINHAVK